MAGIWQVRYALWFWGYGVGVVRFELGMRYGLFESGASISCWCAFIVIERFECERFRWPRIIKEMGLF